MAQKIVRAIIPVAEAGLKSSQSNYRPAGVCARAMPEVIQTTIKEHFFD